MTIHKSKGLEFDNVYLNFEYKDPEFKTFEEINLHYVGITRSKHNLFVWTSLIWIHQEK